MEGLKNRIQIKYLLLFLFFLQIIFTWVIPFYISEGVLIGGDHAVHLHQILDVSENQDLTFVNKWYREGIVNDYPPLYRVLGNVIFLITGVKDKMVQLAFSTLFVAIVLAFGVFIIYGIGNLIFREKRIALFSSLFYCLSTSVSVYLVQLPVNSIAIILGLVTIWGLLSFREDIDKKKKVSCRKPVFITIIYSSLFYFHLGAAFIFFLFFFLPMIFLFLKKNIIKKCLTIIPILVLLAIILLAPFFIWQREIEDVNRKLLYTTGIYGGSTAYEGIEGMVSHIISFGDKSPHTFQSDQFIFYCVGWLSFVLAVIGIIFYFKDRKKYPYLLLVIVWFLLLSLAVFGYKTGIYFSAGWRYPNFWSIPIVFLAGFALFNITKLFNQTLIKFLILSLVITLLGVSNYSKIIIERSSKNTPGDIKDIQEIEMLTNKNDIIIAWPPNASLIHFLTDRKIAFIGSERSNIDKYCAYDLIRGDIDDERRAECLDLFNARYIFITKPPQKKYWMGSEVYKASSQEAVNSMIRSQILKPVFETERNILFKLVE